MRISELIIHLDRIRDLHGDIEVTRQDGQPIDVLAIEAKDGRHIYDEYQSAPRGKKMHDAAVAQLRRIHRPKRNAELVHDNSPIKWTDPDLERRLRGVR